MPSTVGINQEEAICDFVRSTNVVLASDHTWGCNSSSNGYLPNTPVCSSANGLSNWLGITCENNCVTEIILDGTTIYDASHGAPVLTKVASVGLSTNQHRSLFVEDQVQLAGSIPASIGNLVTLRVLKLPYNYLKGPLPSTIGALVSLSVLDLSFNSLSHTLPQTLGGLTALTSLQLAYNRFTGALPSEIGTLSLLKSISLQGNAFSGTVPSALCNSLTSLSTFLNLNQSKSAICYDSCFAKFVNQSSHNLIHICPTKAPTTGTWYLKCRVGYNPIVYVHRM